MSFIYHQLCEYMIGPIARLVCEYITRESDTDIIISRMPFWFKSELIWMYECTRLPNLRWDAEKHEYERALVVYFGRAMLDIDNLTQFQSMCEDIMPREKNREI